MKIREPLSRRLHQYHQANPIGLAFFVAKGYVFPRVPAESCGLREPAIPPPLARDFSLTRPFHSVFERVGMRRSLEVRN